MILTASSVELARVARTLTPYFFSKAALTGRTSWLMIWVVYQTTSPSFFAASTKVASAAWAHEPARLKAAAIVQRRYAIAFLPWPAPCPTLRYSVPDPGFAAGAYSAATRGNAKPR